MEIQNSMNVPEKFDYLFKIVLVGDSGVGKTNLLSQLTKEEFSTTTPATIGVEFATISFKIGDDIVKAQIWDTAGQERYRAITSAYYRGTYGALVVYDITRKATLTQSINHWLIQLRQYSRDDTTIMLIGNKIDVSEQRGISYDEGRNIGEQNNLAFFETSALSGENVRKVFFELIKTIYEKNKAASTTTLKKTNKNANKTVEPLKKFSNKKKRGCC